MSLTWFYHRRVKQLLTLFFVAVTLLSMFPPENKVFSALGARAQWVALAFLLLGMVLLMFNYRRMMLVCIGCSGAISFWLHESNRLRLIKPMQLRIDLLQVSNHKQDTGDVLRLSAGRTADLALVLTDCSVDTAHLIPPGFKYVQKIGLDSNACLLLLSRTAPLHIDTLQAAGIVAWLAGGTSGYPGLPIVVNRMVSIEDLNRVEPMAGLINGRFIFAGAFDSGLGEVMLLRNSWAPLKTTLHSVLFPKTAPSDSGSLLFMLNSPSIKCLHTDTLRARDGTITGMGVVFELPKLMENEYSQTNQ